LENCEAEQTNTKGDEKVYHSFLIKWLMINALSGDEKPCHQPKERQFCHSLLLGFSKDNINKDIRIEESLLF
jgi:hypothetical protein